jgi:hypothetical protein
MNLISELKSQDFSVGIATGYGLDDSGSIRGRVTIIFSSITFRSALAPTKHSIEWALGTVSPPVKRLERGAKHSPLSSAEINNDGIITPLRISLHGVVIN